MGHTHVAVAEDGPALAVALATTALLGRPLVRVPVLERPAVTVLEGLAETFVEAREARPV